MGRYAIWNKKDRMITPSGAVFTAEEWVEKHPAAGILKTVCAGGELNGAFFGVFSEMKSMYEKAGCDFSGLETDEEILSAIEAFEDARNAQPGEPTAEERIAAALEYQVISSLPDEEV